MSRDLLARLASRWQGVVLTLVIGAGTLWLAATGQLVLYIHPRYVVFTVVMIAVGMLLSLLALALGGADEAAQDHGHDHGPGSDAEPADSPSVGPRPRRRPGRRLRGALTAAGAVVTLGLALGLILLPPATLSSSTASTRGLGEGAAVVGPAAGGAGAPAASDAATAKYTVLQWATTLRQTSDLSFYENKRVDVTGFVSPSPTDPADTFIVTRFVITCCAVDAQPVGVTVYAPNWRSSLKTDQWVRITGAFTADPSRTSTASIALVPRSLTPVARPADPYLT